MTSTSCYFISHYVIFFRNFFHHSFLFIHFFPLLQSCLQNGKQKYALSTIITLLLLLSLFFLPYIFYRYRDSANRDIERARTSLYSEFAAPNRHVLLRLPCTRSSRVCGVSDIQVEKFSITCFNFYNFYKSLKSL